MTGIGLCPSPGIRRQSALDGGARSGTPKISITPCSLLPINRGEFNASEPCFFELQLLKHTAPLRANRRFAASM
jgi:hypothetical protein